MDEIDLAEVARKARFWTGQHNIGSDYTNEELAALHALDAYKTRYHRPNPHVREVLAVLRSIGWQPPANP